MARCGCAGTNCSCLIQGGSGVTVEGAGTETNPYVISSTGGGGGGGGFLTVTDTQTVDLNLTGSGSEETPYRLTANATVAMENLVDYSGADPTNGQVLAWNGNAWQPVPATTAPPGAIAVGTGLLGDGSSGDPVRLDPGSTAGFVVPTGTIMAYAGDVAPDGWLLCNDTAVGRGQYADLFALIGTTYGPGNGSTTFNVPNLVNRGPVGAGSSYDLAEQVGSPTHTHSQSAHTHPIPGHTHSIPAHNHNLDNNGYAKISLWSNNFWTQRITIPTWQASWRTIGINQGDSSARINTGVPLDGRTANSAAGTSGSWSGATGSGGDGVTGAATSLPPSLGLNFIIKT